MRPTTHIVFACGGSAGYLYPGLAVAADLQSRAPEARISFVGSGTAAERHPVRAAGFDYVAMPSQPVPRSPLRAMRFIAENVAGYWAARWFFKEQQASLVVGLGGYASAAAIRAGMSRKIPTVLIEQNAVPSHLTRWLARSVDMVCAGYGELRDHLPPRTPLAITGNPARRAFVQRFHQQSAAGKAASRGFAQQAVDDTPRRLVVVGGSGGARTLNQSMPLAAQRLGGRLRGWQIIHQSGEGQLQHTVDRYRATGVDALTVSFIDEMAPVLFESDLVVCRSAGTTLAELALAGIAAVLVPYPRDAEAYQLANAELIAAAGAATVIDETSLDGPLDAALVGPLESLLTDHARRCRMAARMRSLARPDAAACITDSLCSILGVCSPRAAA